MYKRYIIICFVCFPLILSAQETSKTHLASGIDYFTDASNVLPAIRQKFLSDANKINSDIHGIIWNKKNSSKELSEKNVSFTLLGFYQENDKDAATDTINSKYFILISIPDTIHGYLTKMLKSSNFLLLAENQETCDWSNLHEDTIDPLSSIKPWTKVKSFKRIVRILNFKPFPNINELFNKETGD